MSSRHFLSLDDLGTAGIEDLIERAIDRKRRAPTDRPLVGKSLAMVFEKASTRTRVSFEAAMTRLGGHAIFLSPGDTQIGRGEPVEDTARVLSGMCDAIMIRNHSHAVLEQFAAYSKVPVINGLTDRLHPCQLLADLQTYVEHRGSIRGAKVAWIGDGNNMCHSYINAARLMGFSLRIAAPEGYRPDALMLRDAGNAVTVCDQAQEAVDGADLVVTDVWASMGDEDDRETRLADFANYQVNRALMSWASDDALFMHCLPAHRGEEVSAEVIDGPASVVWDEAENRLHAQTALLLKLLEAE
ncbi:ornithine carbamoyltransferase [Salinisphaera hydrothermalis]|uniref:Ornithine carbamoyltransferase n=1 Tax=Salinisphaera hydrothermalis (strain C41B8) TaxID=1304275 RepID=A0A084IH20_SALHC|nr:ornithine carbamoyltransferase [Salinisphaera hydrothermalis]KEZ76004.1 ornithine carbamoyltransferase [Salinisphaera hydrothermalis C41B8]